MKQLTAGGAGLPVCVVCVFMCVSANALEPVQSVGRKELMLGGWVGVVCVCIMSVFLFVGVISSAATLSYTYTHLACSSDCSPPTGLTVKGLRAGVAGEPAADGMRGSVRLPVGVLLDGPAD